MEWRSLQTTPTFPCADHAFKASNTRPLIAHHPLERHSASNWCTQTYAARSLHLPLREANTSFSTLTTTLEWHGSIFYIRRRLTRSQRSFKLLRPSQKMPLASKYIIFTVITGEVSTTTGYSKTYLPLVVSPSNHLLHTLKTRMA